jgi:hypothetical protein
MAKSSNSDLRISGNVSRMMRATAKSRPFSSGGGSFDNRWQPQNGSDGRITPVVLNPVERETVIINLEGKSETIRTPYGIIFQHYHKSSNKFFRCSAGIVQRQHDNGTVYLSPGDLPCLGCYYAAQGKQTGMSYARNLQVMDGVLIDKFHSVESTDPKKVSKKTNKPFVTLEQCGRKTCVHCQSRNEKTRETQWGKPIYWPIGPTHAIQLADFVDGALASRCQCNGNLTVPAYACPKCDAVFHNLDEEPLGTDDFIDLRDNEHECGECGVVSTMNPVYECSNDQCEKPTPLSLWDVKMEIFKTGESTQTAISVKSYQFLTNKEREQLKDVLSKEINLNRVFPKKSIKKQAELTQLAIPEELAAAAAKEPDTGSDGEGGSTKGSTAWDED